MYCCCYMKKNSHLSWAELCCAVHCLLQVISVCLGCAIHSNVEQQNKYCWSHNRHKRLPIDKRQQQQHQQISLLFSFCFRSYRAEPYASLVLCVERREYKKKCPQTHRRCIYSYVGLSRIETLGYSSNRSAGKVGTSNTSLVNKTK